jgi:hypothetical protein
MINVNPLFNLSLENLCAWQQWIVGFVCCFWRFSDIIVQKPCFPCEKQICEKGVDTGLESSHHMDFANLFRQYVIYK